MPEGRQGALSFPIPTSFETGSNVEADIITLENSGPLHPLHKQENTKGFITQEQEQKSRG